MSLSRKNALILSRFSCLSDNYGYLVHDPDSGETAAIDTPDAEAVLAEAGSRGWRITQIWNTHWHPDHAGGNEAIKAVTGCTIYGPQEVQSRLNAPLDTVLDDGDTVRLGDHVGRVIATPGHTLGHIAYYLPDSELAFVGDTLFALGCGRMFEGQPDMFWNSLSKLTDLPDTTQICCAHEYTMANLEFALSVDESNPALLSYGARIRALRQEGKPTVPCLLSDELMSNPFLRSDDPQMQDRMGHPGDAVATFAELRKRKDNF